MVSILSLSNNINVDVSDVNSLNIIEGDDDWQPNQISKASQNKDNFQTKSAMYIQIHNLSFPFWEGSRV